MTKITYGHIELSDDNPISKPQEDKLFYYDKMAMGVANRLQVVPTPCVFGIYGGWGSGKSGLINLIKFYVETGKIGRAHV